MARQTSPAGSESADAQLRRGLRGAAFRTTVPASTPSPLSWARRPDRFALILTSAFGFSGTAIVSFLPGSIAKGAEPILTGWPLRLRRSLGGSLPLRRQLGHQHKLARAGSGTRTTQGHHRLSVLDQHGRGGGRPRVRWGGRRGIRWRRADERDQSVVGGRALRDAGNCNPGGVVQAKPGLESGWVCRFRCCLCARVDHLRCFQRCRADRSRSAPRCGPNRSAMWVIWPVGPAR